MYGGIIRHYQMYHNNIASNFKIKLEAITILYVQVGNYHNFCICTMNLLFSGMIVYLETYKPRLQAYYKQSFWWIKP